jgi:hypothetical protein
MIIAIKLDRCSFYVKIRIWPCLDRIISSLFDLAWIVSFPVYLTLLGSYHFQFYGKIQIWPCLDHNPCLVFFFTIIITNTLVFLDARSKILCLDYKTKLMLNSWSMTKPNWPYFLNSRSSLTHVYSLRNPLSSYSETIPYRSHTSQFY